MIEEEDRPQQQDQQAHAPRKLGRPRGPNWKPKPPRQTTLTFKSKMALLQALERKRIGQKIDYRSISQRTGVASSYIRHLVSMYGKGKVDLGVPETPEEVEIDAKTQHETTSTLLKRLQAMLLRAMEAELLKVEDEMTRGEKSNYKNDNLSWILNELRKTAQLRRITEQGYSFILDNASRRRSKQLADQGITPEIETKIIQADDEARSVARLRKMQEEEMMEDGQSETIDTESEVMPTHG